MIRYRIRASIRPIMFFVVAATFGTVGLWVLYPVARNEGSNTSGVVTGANAVVEGKVQTESLGDVVTRLVVPVEFKGETGIALSAEPGRVNAEVVLSNTASAVIPGTYTLTWTDGNGDTTLDPGEHAELTVALPAASTIHQGDPLNLVIKPAAGGPLVVANVLGD